MRDLPRIVLLATMAGCGVLFGLGASAQDAARPAGHSCREDMERLCSDVKPGGGARIQCLKDHEDELSDACRAQIAEHSAQGHEHASKIVQACGDNAKQLCAGVEPGNGGILRCLRDHEADLSSHCRDALAQLRR
jgi:Cysteine rich repeat